MLIKKGNPNFGISEVSSKLKKCSKCGNVITDMLTLDTEDLCEECKSKNVKSDIKNR